MELITAASALRTYNQTQYSREIDPADHMWNTGQAWYWGVGRSGLDCIMRGLAASPIAEPRSILDLACGHGRVARHISAAFPAARLIWCDIEGAEFCAKHFGGEAICSDRELLNVRLPCVDAVWVGSLFTHVAEPRARTWLAHIAACLNPGGVMIATFHGRTSTRLYRSALPHMTPMLDRIEAECSVTGWGYEAVDAATDPGWGFSVTAIDRLARVAADVPNTLIGGLAEGGWAANHDVLTLVQH